MVNIELSNVLDMLMLHNLMIEFIIHYFKENRILYFRIVISL